jgi:tetrapyrrole methylase family protein/MazG family protein
MTSLYLPPLPHAGAYESLQKIAARLRAPDGCPWDREQTHLSLRTNLLEETYEVLEALDAEDAGKLREELGDLLLQVAMHVQIASEEGEFKLPDVVGGIVAKLIRRHPHVFGDAAVSSVEEVLANWEEIKRAERAETGETRRSFLDGVPGTLPALAQAQAYITRARRRNLPVGAVLSESDIAGLLGEPTPERLGEVLWALAAWADARGLDAEAALRETNSRHKARLSDLDAANVQAV